MSIDVDFECTQCHQRLVVKAEYIGKEVRCPHCEYCVVVPQRSPDEAEKTVQEVPADAVVSADTLPDDLRVPPSQDEPTPLATPANDQVQVWKLRTPEGYEYGPVDRQKLDSWVAQGRVDCACSLKPDESDDWISAVDVYPILDESGNPFAAKKIGNRFQHLEPHRGRLIVGLALAGCVLPFLSVWPAVLGTRDLRQIRQGKMDPSGDSLTRAGQAIAMVASLIWVGAFAIALLAMLIGVIGQRA